jgi:hypothetical protein
MAVATPVFVESYVGKLLIGGSSGVCLSLIRWRLFLPENKKRQDNYCVYPMSSVNVTPTYVKCEGGWDTANPPHATVTGGAYGIVYGATLTIFLGISGTTAGYLGSFKITSEEIGHSMIEGADFAFTADLQGTLTRSPTT